MGKQPGNSDGTAENTKRPGEKGGPSPNPAGRRGKGIVQVSHADAWLNAFTGLGGTTYDKRTGVGFEVRNITAEAALSLWRGDDTSARIIETYPADACRAGFEVRIEDDKEASEAVEAALRELDAVTHLEHALGVERCMGGAAIWPVINDGQGDLGMPLNEAQISSIRHLHVFEPRELTPWKWYTDAASPKFGEPEVYLVQMLSTGGGASAPMMLMHETRLVLLQGRRPSKQIVTGTVPGWGDSVLLPVLEALTDFATAWGGASGLLTDFAQGVLEIEDLANIASENEKTALMGKLRLFDMFRSSLRSVVIDAKDKFHREQTPVTGLPELLDRFATRMAAAAEMPVTKLMGISPAGLNATGESDQANWDDRVDAYRAKHVLPRLKQIIRLVMLAIDGPTNGQEPENWSVDGCSLRQPTEKETADAHLAQAQVDKIYIEAGVLSPEEVAISRFGGDTYSFHTIVDFEARARLEPPAEGPPKTEQQIAAEEAAKAQAAAQLASATQSVTKGPGPNPNGGPDATPVGQ
jgi:uncharacterized protein